ncbi:hypothetical protein NQZ68_039872 [Dissostichus eleginoides]|nr:hypothetical protein NQZ68_039872 [Dissostichus eleginoides]
MGGSDSVSLSHQLHPCSLPSTFAMLLEMIRGLERIWEIFIMSFLGNKEAEGVEESREAERETGRQEESKKKDGLVTSEIDCPVPQSHDAFIDTFLAMAITVRLGLILLETDGLEWLHQGPEPSAAWMEALFKTFMPRYMEKLFQCPVPGWIAVSRSIPSGVTFSGTLMQWDISLLGSTRQATAKARTQPLWIYHPNKRPLPGEATVEYIKPQHNSSENTPDFPRSSSHRFSPVRTTKVRLPEERTAESGAAHALKTEEL